MKKNRRKKNKKKFYYIFILVEYEITIDKPDRFFVMEIFTIISNLIPLSHYSIKDIYIINCT